MRSSVANTMRKQPKRVLRLLLLLFPTSLVAFLLLLILACNGFLCFTTEPVSTHHTPLSTTRRSIREAIPRSQILAVKQDIPVPKLVGYKRSELLKENGNGSYSITTKFRVSRKNKDIIRSLHSNARSRLFSSRAEKFFHGSSTNSSQSNSSCKRRFFMTWISSLESFGQREMFAMESLFKSHPDACLLVLSNTMDSGAGTRLLRPLLDKGFQVSAMSPDYTYLFKHTPAEQWFARLRKGEVNPGDVSLGQNLSNLLRLATLYKFGGVYLDTDVIIIKSFSGLKNVIGAQTIDSTTGNWSRLNNAVLVFDKKHPLLYKFIEEFALTFDGSKWGHNGPYLVSRVVLRLEGRPGFEFTVLPPEAFYPVSWTRIKGLFRGPRSVYHSKWITMKLQRIQGQSFAVHLWNRQSRKAPVEAGSVIGLIMLDCCVRCDSSVTVNE